MHRMYGMDSPKAHSHIDNFTLVADNEDVLPTAILLYSSGTS